MNLFLLKTQSPNWEDKINWNWLYHHDPRKGETFSEIERQFALRESPNF